MQDSTIRTHTLDNGLTVVIEPMSAVQSAAFTLLVPCGGAEDPAGKNGLASVLCDLLVRGAGDRDSQQLSAALDNLGVQRQEHVGTLHLSCSGATLAENLPEALKLYGDIIRRPHLPENQFEAARAAVAQGLQAIEDEPRQKIILELRRRTYPTPWGMPPEGELADLPNIDLNGVRAHYDRCFRPNGTILAVAGNVDPDRILETIDEVFGDWGRKPEPAVETGDRGPAHDHIHHDSTQTHIGIAYDAVPYRHPDYYAAWGAVNVLSGGMSSRLFSEVREKRGLCYAVFATLNSLREVARVLCYAGTTTERAQQTLEVTLQELGRLGDDITQEELDRQKARAKSGLIMQQESTSSRSSSIARDWYHLGRVKTLEEIRGEIEALTPERVMNYVREHPARDFTILTIGPQALEVPAGVS